MSAAQPLQSAPSPQERIADALRAIRRDRGRAVHDLAQESLAFFACRGEMRETDVITSLIVEKDIPAELQHFVPTALSELRKHDVLEWRGMGRLNFTPWAHETLDPARETW